MSSMPQDPIMSPAPVKTAAEADALVSEVMGMMSELVYEPSIILTWVSPG